MAVVPYTFAAQSGAIPLSELDVNFANVKAYATTAGTVLASNQPNIATVGTLSSLTVSGNVTSANLTTGLIVGTLATSVLANINQVGTLANLSVAGNIVAVGNISGQRGNFVVVDGALTQAYQPTITTVGNLIALTVSGNTAVGGNLTVTNDVTVAGQIISTSDISGANISGSGSMSVTGLASVGALTVTGGVNNNDLYVNGDAVIQGNLSVTGTTTTVNSADLTVNDLTITVANNVSTSLLIDGAGIDAGNPTVSYLHYSNLLKGWTTANNFNVGGNLTVTGTGTFTGSLTAPTASNATNNTQVATTAFVSNAVANGIGGLGTVAYQNANNVTITGGTFSGNVSIAGGTINSLNVTSIGNNSFGARTVSTSAPVGGNDGDIWYQI